MSLNCGDDSSLCPTCLLCRFEALDIPSSVLAADVSNQLLSNCEEWLKGQKRRRREPGVGGARGGGSPGGGASVFPGPALFLFQKGWPHPPHNIFPRWKKDNINHCRNWSTLKRKRIKIAWSPLLWENPPLSVNACLCAAPLRTARSCVCWLTRGYKWLVPWMPVFPFKNFTYLCILTFLPQKANVNTPVCVFPDLLLIDRVTHKILNLFLLPFLCKKWLCYVYIYSFCFFNLTIYIN